MTQQGMQTKDAVAMVDSMLEFPSQLESATVVLFGNPEDIGESGLELEVGLTAKTGSPFGKFLTDLRPCNLGTPVMPADADAMMTLQLSIDPKGMMALLEPFMEFGLSFTYQDDESRKAARELNDRMLRLFDGGLGWSIGKGMSMSMLAGYADGEALAKMLHSEEYVAMVRSQKMRDLEVEITPNAFEHRGAKFIRMHLTNEGPPNLMMPDDELRNYYAAVGNHLVVAGSEGQAKKLADAVIDQKAKRTALDDGAVMTMNFRLAQLIESLGDTIGLPPVGDDMPESFSLVVFTSGNRLRFKVRAK
jgi:hypothetical protein